MERKGTQLLKISEIARLVGLNAQTIRNYERQGLLKATARSEAGHRLYGQEEVARLRFLRRAKLAGLTLAEAKGLLAGLLALVAKGERGEDIPHLLKEELEEKLRETEWKMQELAAFRDSLLSYRWRCEQKEDQDQI
jgi:DNA-binding transcriptional MerR regulator